MAFLTPLLLLLLLLLSRAATVDTACRYLTTFPHASVPFPFSAPTSLRVPLHFHFPCNTHGRAIGRDRPLILLMQGALVRPVEYRSLGDALARRGFVVAIPDYTQRQSLTIFSQAPLQGTKALRCPSNGQFETTSIVSSLRKTIIFGHSYGGATAQMAFNGLCDPLKHPVQPPPENLTQHPDFRLRYACEQFKKLPISVRVLGMVSFEGHNEITGTNFPRMIPYVAINSRFYQERAASYFGKRSYGGRLASVLVSNANHFGPNDFVTQNNNQRTVCARPRPPPEDKFTTTRKTQNRVVRTVARITLASYRSFVGEEGWKPLKALVGKKKLLVGEVKIQ